MNLREAFLTVPAVLVVLVGQRAVPDQTQLVQAQKDQAPLKAITVTGSDPVEKAMDVIEQRYGVPIDYSGPIYASTMDTQLMYSLHGKRLQVPLLIPRIRTISIRYVEVKQSPQGIPYISCDVQPSACNPVSAWPERGITSLIQSVLDDLATQGGPVFTVRKIQVDYGAFWGVGPRWEVYPLRVRNASGTFVEQPDFLGATMHIPAARRWPGQLLQLVAQQLTNAWGSDFRVGLLGLEYFGQSDAGGVRGAKEPMLGAEGVTARHAILGRMGPRDVIRLRGGAPDAKGASFGINIVAMPYREPPRPPTPEAVPARLVPARPYPVYDWVVFGRSARGILDIQKALVKAGYLHAEPASAWNASAIGALRRFQTGNGLRSTGVFDAPTATKLRPFLPAIPAHLDPGKPAMDPALAYWLGSTPDGRREIAEALTKAGFYHGPLTDEPNNPQAAAALKAFQAANRIRPSGYFDYATAEKIAPYLPKSKD